MATLLRIALTALVVLLIARIVPSVRVKGYGAALGVAVVYGLLNYFLKELLVFVSMPMIILSFGLFLLVLNGFLLWLTDKLLRSFEIKTKTGLVLATLGMTFGSVIVDGLVDRLL
ncbi:MAG: phage holin family protein [Myxococcota bacterium]